MVLHRPPTAISQEEVQAEKDRLRAIDARPIKKVAEAKARKQKRMAVSLLTPTHPSVVDDLPINKMPLRTSRSQVSSMRCSTAACSFGSSTPLPSFPLPISFYHLILCISHQVFSRRMAVLSQLLAHSPWSLCRCDHLALSSAWQPVQQVLQTV